VNAPNLSNQKFGMNGGFGLSKRISRNWCLDANATVHHFFIDQTIDDVYYVFTDGADAPVILDVAVGVVVDLR